MNTLQNRHLLDAVVKAKSAYWDAADAFEQALAGADGFGRCHDPVFDLIDLIAAGTDATTYEQMQDICKLVEADNA